MTAQEVKALEAGSRVDMIGADQAGRTVRTACIVAFRGSPANKFLTYRIHGEIRRCAIRDYPGVHYEQSERS